MDTMQCIQKTSPGPGNIALKTVSAPSFNDDEILVKVDAAAICGTDLHIMHWNDWAQKRVRPPVTMGHEFAGAVVARGKNVDHVKVGDIVSVETHFVCHRCRICACGNEHVCPNTWLFGIHRDGCFAEYAVFPSQNAFVCDPALPIEVNSLMEPLGVAVHAAMEFPLAGKSVAVVGCGPIGLMAVAVARKVGAAQVIGIELNALRAKLALEMGADTVINPVKEDAVQRVLELTGGLGVQNVIEFSGSLPAIKSALSYIRPGGQIAAAGLPDSYIDFQMSEFVYRGIQMHGIAGRRMFQSWEQMRGLLRGGLDISPVVTHTFPLAQYKEGFDLMETGNCGKVILCNR